MRVLRRGDVGPAVAEVRSTLAALGLLPAFNGSRDHVVFDSAMENAVRTFQQQRGLITDGVVGTATFAAMRAATYRLGGRPLAYLVSQPMTGDDVFALQERLLELGYDAGRPDGVFGPQVERALRSFQREYGLVVDGIYGTATCKAEQSALGVGVDGIRGKQTISAEQRLTGAGVDGIDGPDTNRHLQNWLNNHGYNCGAADGIRGRNTISALQRCLNDGKFHN